jgi:hypothetical protein
MNSSWRLLCAFQTKEHQRSEREQQSQHARRGGQGKLSPGTKKQINNKQRNINQQKKGSKTGMPHMAEEGNCHPGQKSNSTRNKLTGVL